MEVSEIPEKNLQDDELRLPFQANFVRHNISYNFTFGSTHYLSYFSRYSRDL